MQFWLSGQNNLSVICSINGCVAKTVTISWNFDSKLINKGSWSCVQTPCYWRELPPIIVIACFLTIPSSWSSHASIDDKFDTTYIDSIMIIVISLSEFPVHMKNNLSWINTSILITSTTVPLFHIGMHD